MPHTPLFTDSSTKLFPVSLAAFEFIIEGLSKLDIIDNEAISELYCKAMVEHCFQPTPTTEGVNYISERLRDANESVGGKSRNITKPSKRSFSSEFSKMMSDLHTDQLIMQMCEYDYAKAKTVYCTVDRDIALAMLNTYLTRLQHDQQVVFEAAVYGFGGSFEGGKKVDVEYDLTDHNSGAHEALKAIF